MSRRGWVAAQTGPDEWMRLQVFDDGWVELPGFGRSLSDTRIQLRRALTALGGLLGGLGAVYLLGLGLSKVEDPPEWLLILPLALFIGLLVWGRIVLVRAALRRSRRRQGDARQARAFRAAGNRISRTPGAPLFGRASSAKELAEWLDGGTHVRAVDITDVRTTREDKDHLVTVRLSSGVIRTYRSPDGKLTALLSSFTSGIRLDGDQPGRGLLDQYRNP